MALSPLAVTRQTARLVRSMLFNSQNPTKLQSDDVVLVSGGSSGLGAAIARQVANYGCTVVVLDIKPPPRDKREPKVDYINCDISRVDQVEAAAKHIFVKHGPVSVLINNAGITNNKPLLDQQLEDIDRVLQVNLYACFVTIKTFLPAMLEQKRGYIVSIASVLGTVAPANLTSYAASKSGVIALHEALTYELGPPSRNNTGVKTLLVNPGQLATPLFKDITPPPRILAPLLFPDYAAIRIVRELKRGSVGRLNMPSYTNFIPVIRTLPWQLQEFSRGLSGMDHSA